LVAPRKIDPLDGLTHSMVEYVSGRRFTIKHRHKETRGENIRGVISRAQALLAEWLSVALRRRRNTAPDATRRHTTPHDATRRHT
jgi:capsid protein